MDNLSKYYPLHVCLLQNVPLLVYGCSCRLHVDLYMWVHAYTQNVPHYV